MWPLTGPSADVCMAQMNQSSLQGYRLCTSLICMINTHTEPEGRKKTLIPLWHQQSQHLEEEEERAAGAVNVCVNHSFAIHMEMEASKKKALCVCGWWKDAGLVCNI
uniref:Uncharacterized protein n=1 Tax=Knipowitschia caucasica TaxID=637954 RepID=A0AAV2KNQ7_KNICA